MKSDGIRNRPTTPKAPSSSATAPRNVPERKPVTQRIDPGRTGFDAPTGPARQKLTGEKAAAPATLQGNTFRITPGTSFTALRAFAPASSETATRASTTAAVTDPAAQATEAAAERVRTALAEGGTGAAAIALEQEARALGSPEAVDALLEELAPEVDTLSRDLAHRARHGVDDSGEGAQRQTEAGITSLAAVADLASEDGVEQLSSSLGEAFAAEGDAGDINQFDDVFDDLAKEGKGVRLAGALALDLINNRGLVEAGNEILNEATDGVNKIREDLATAQGEVAVHEQRLAADLAAFGPGMTAEQRQAYTDAFWADPERAADRDRLNSLSNQLAQTLEETGPALETLAAQGDSDAAKVLLDSYTLLANTDTHAAAAVEFVGRVNNNPALAAQMDEHTDGSLEERLQNEVLAPGLPRAQAGIFAAHQAEGPEGATRAAAELAELTGPLTTAGSEFASIKREVDNFKLALDTLSNFRAGADWDTSRAQAIISQWDQKNPFQRALAVATVGYGIYAGAQAFADGEYPQALQSFLGAARGGVLMASGLLGMFSRTADLAGDVARVGGRFLPAIGLALDATQLAEDIGNLRKDGADAGEIISTIGTGISLAGDVLEFIPAAGTVLGGALGIVGGVVHAIGGFVSSIINGNEEREALAEDRARLLEQAGVPADTRELLTADPNTAAQLGNLGLSREQFLAQLEAREAAFASGNVENIQNIDTAWRVAALYGLQGDEAVAFINDLRDESPESLRLLDQAIGPNYFFDPELGGGGEETVRNAQDQVFFLMQRELGPEFAERYGLTVDPSQVNTGFFVATAQVG